MKVDISCKKCGQRRRVDIGVPAGGQSQEEYLHFLSERLMHQPSFECFSGHLELRPPVPEFWEIHWDTIGD